MEQANISELRILVESYYDVQDQRIRAVHRIAKYSGLTGNYNKDVKFDDVLDAIDENFDNPDTLMKEVAKLLKSTEGVSLERFKQLRQYHDEVDRRMFQSELYLKKKIMSIIKTKPIWTKWLVDVKGIGPCIAGGLVAWLDPHRANHASSFWKYAGLAVNHGEADRRKRGEKISYNPKLRTMCWKAGESFVKTRGEYRKQYEHFRAQVDAKPCNKIHLAEDKKTVVPCSKAHKYAMAKRLTVKLFISHLWKVWRQLEGLPIDRPYAMEHGHSEHSIIPPLRDKGTWGNELGI